MAEVFYVSRKKYEELLLQLKNLKEVNQVEDSELLSTTAGRVYGNTEVVMTSGNKDPEEWAEIIPMLMMPKCEMLGYCPERYSCGKTPKKAA